MLHEVPRQQVFSLSVYSEPSTHPHVWKRQLGSAQGTGAEWLVAAVSGARHSILDSGVTDDSGKTTGRDCLCTHDKVGNGGPQFLARARREAVANGGVLLRRTCDRHAPPRGFSLCSFRSIPAGLGSLAPRLASCGGATLVERERGYFEGSSQPSQGPRLASGTCLAEETVFSPPREGPPSLWAVKFCGVVAPFS